MNIEYLEKSNVLLFGGTFDPFTYGHENAVIRLRQNFPDSKLYVVPAGNPSHKKSHNVSRFDQRVRMAELALEEAGVLNDPNVIVSDLERNLSGRTIETINAIEEAEDAIVQLVIGSDWVKSLHTWFDFYSILQRGVWVLQRLTDEVVESDLMAGMNLIYGEPIHGYSGAPRDTKAMDELVRWVRPSVAEFMQNERLHAFAQNDG